MTIAEILAKGAGLPVDTILSVLRAGAKEVPDAAAGVERFIAKITTPFSAENLASVGGAVIAEILSGKLDPRKHPSDLG